MREAEDPPSLAKQKHEAEAAGTGSAQKKLKRSSSPDEPINIRDMGGYPTRHKVQALANCSPDYTPTEMYGILTRKNSSVDRALKILRPNSTQDISTDDILNIGFRENVIKAHLKFPGMRLQDIYDAVTKHPFDLPKGTSTT